MSDQHAHFKQMHEHARALRVDISSAKAAGADPKLILLAQQALVLSVRYTKDALLVAKHRIRKNG